MKSQALVNSGTGAVILLYCWNMPGRSCRFRMLWQYPMSGGAAVADVISSWVAGNWNTSPVYLAVSSSAAGLSNAYENPRDLGVDRWAAMIAAYHDCQDTVCVIDCGSAITIDVVRADGLHLGGMIAPGLDMMRRSLAGNAAGIRLPPDDTAQPVKLLANSTAEAVNNGTVYMAAAMIDRVIADVAARHHADVEVVITGGDAPRIMPLLGATPRFVPELVLRGVAIIAMETACDT